MKKLISCLMISCLLFFSGIGSVFAAVLTTTNNTFEEQYKDVEKIVDENVINKLKAMNVEYVIEDGNIIKLKTPTPEVIEEVNNKFRAMDKSNITLTSYPTSWNHMRLYDMSTSKKFQKATKSAFGSSVTTWLTGATASAATLGKLAAAVFGTYYFVNTDEENVYYFTSYYFRELGPGFFDPNGTFVGDYEIKKVERTTKSSTGTGGQVNTRYEKSTIVEPFF